jgi:arsenate reductase-like glutaredoxin family protein
MEIQQVMEELKRQLSASQQKVEELTKENGNLVAELQQQKQDFDQQKQNYEVY